MALRIYNSLTQQKEEFKPLDPAGKEVKMYVCGPTVYDEPHIGHLRSAYVFEVIRNWLTHSGYNVKFVRNVTDIDDKIIDKARQEKPSDLKVAVEQVSTRYFRRYKEDLKALGISEPWTEPRATQHIPNILKFIEELIGKDFAYRVANTPDVYFDVRKFPAYGKLSKQKTEEMLESARGEAGSGKRDPLDFALWKGAKPDEPAWDSPWGPGRPGWHIECSAMNRACLGDQIDIHGGGLDLKFPHHENEIAQSESATGKPFAKAWIHHGLVTAESQKMSKSLKNFATLDSVRAMSGKRYGLPALKALFVGTHYASPLDFSERAMAESRAQWDRFIDFFREAKRRAGGARPAPRPEFEKAFAEAMDDDFNTPKALAVMHDLVSAARKEGSAEAYASAQKLLEKWAGVLGGFFDSMQLTALLANELEVQGLLKQRTEAKNKKDFATADRIRKELTDKGVQIRDLPDGTCEVV